MEWQKAGVGRWKCGSWVIEYTGTRYEVLGGTEIKTFKTLKAAKRHCEEESNANSSVE